MNRPVPIGLDDDGGVLGDLLRSHLPLDETDFPPEFRSTSAGDLVLRDLPPAAPGQAVPDRSSEPGSVDSAPSLLDQGLKPRQTPQ